MSVILVLGGAGYIGSHACKALAAAGHTPVVYDNLVFGHRWAVRWGPLEEGDLADRARLDEVFRRWKPDAVMHFAAFAFVGESVIDPGKYYRNNVAATLALLETMRDHGVNQLVFSSTCATYGVPDHSPIDEEHPQRPINPYGASKLMVERMLADFGAAHGLRSTTLRYFNAAGADAAGEIGEDHDPETHLIPLVLETALGLRPELVIYGEDYPTADGTCIRDYVHVDDLAQAHLLALDALATASPGVTCYNLGNGQGFSVKEVIASAERVTGRSVKVQVGPRRAGDPPSLVGSAEKIRRELGWTPRHADIDGIVGTAWRWLNRHHRDRVAAQQSREKLPDAEPAPAPSVLAETPHEATQSEFFGHAHVTEITAKGQSLGSDLREIWAYRDLLSLLVRRDISIRYKQSALGVAWAVLQPVVPMLIFSLVFGRFAKLPSEGYPYSVFTLAALLPWLYFARALSSTSDSIVGASNLVTKIYFPRLIIPLSKAISGLADFGVAFVVLALVMAWYRIVPGPALLMLPVFIVVTTLTAFALGLWLTALNVKYRDIGLLLPFLIQVWMYISPIAYSTTLVPEHLRWLYSLNPIVGVVEGFRWSLLGNTPPDPGPMLLSFGIVLVLLVSGLINFRRTERTFADVI